MLKKLFLYLLDKYSKSEKDRMDIYNVLFEKVCCEYNEQTTFGNVYNANIEFIMSNKFINELVEENDKTGLNMIQSGLQKSYNETIDFIKNEKNLNKNK